ncbi:MAG: PhoH family protein [Betaproteobacteria bacterium]|jgi:Phosphate starvation-inducible protein PhoH, predicted ATPase|nr:PhoH family protein [Betaproteobacteria bacterium]
MPDHSLNSHLEFELEPANNQWLANLCGILDENLPFIARHFQIDLRRRGAVFQLSGPDKETLKKAQTALQLCYAQARHPINPEHVFQILTHLNPDSTSLSSTRNPLTLKTSTFTIETRSLRQQQYLEQIRSHALTFGVGPAGTGKTFLAIAAAVEALERDDVSRIMLVRPAVEAGERLGYLPGDLNQKIDPYLRPLMDALYDLLGHERVTRLFDRGIIEIAPLAYMRGRTLNHSFIILDEAQNTTPEQMKMFLTRIGFGTRTVITGDITQIDLHRNQKSGLIEARNVLQRVEGIGFTIFQAEDVVRHPLVQQIVNAYDQWHGNSP